MIIEPKEDQVNQVFNLEKEILRHEKPNIWNVHHEENMERGLEIEFEKFALAVLEHSGLNIDTVTVKTFYSKVEQLKEKNRK